jgi:hypothetical protein
VAAGTKVLGTYSDNAFGTQPDLHERIKHDYF